MTSKTCTFCKCEKPLTMFSQRGGNTGRYFSRCKQCRNEQSKSRYGAAPTVTQDELFAALDYNPETGVFTKKCGASVGHTTKGGYKSISLLGRPCLAHRLAWLWVHGEFPSEDLDHIDGDTGNNRISNLRLCNDSLNAQNIRKAKSNNRHGVLGVTPHQGGWRARIQVNQKPVHLGVFGTPEEAHQAYVAAKRQFHEFCTI